MKTRFAENRIRGLTLFEVLLVIAVLAVVVAILLPGLVPHRSSRSRISCVSNLKQVGLAYRVWAGDNNDNYPMQVSVTNGGTMELVGSGVAFPHFQVMSNELSTPKILFCPNDDDTAKIGATTFETGIPALPPNQVPLTSDKNISYFVGVDADEARPQMFLSGDRNITDGLPRKSGLFMLTTDRPSGWTEKIHVKQGNVGLADGSVFQHNTLGLRTALEQTGVATNRLAMP